MIKSGSYNVKIRRYIRLICSSLLPKLDPLAVPVTYSYNLCSHTARDSLMIPDPAWGKIRRVFLVEKKSASIPDSPTSVYYVIDTCLIFSGLGCFPIFF